MLHQTLFYEFDVCKLIDFIIIDTQLQVVETVMRKQSIIAAAFASRGRLQWFYQTFWASRNNPLLTKIILFGVWEPHTKLPLFRQEYTVLALASHH